jgi:hypothetical protein
MKKVICNQSQSCKIPYCGHKKYHKPQTLFKTLYGRTYTYCNDVSLTCPSVGLVRCKNKNKDGN